MPSPSPSPATQVAGPSAARWAWCAPALIAIALYLPSLRNGFAYDDEIIVANNARIHHWATLLSALRLPYWYDGGHLYRPLTTLSFAVEWIVGGGSPLPFHLVNVLWHAAVVALVARLALQWWSPGAAFAAGLWFAIHPVHVEAVANVVGRSELMCAAALLALAIVTVRAAPPVAAPTPAGEPLASVPITGDTGQLFLIAALSAAAMATKETGIAAPVIAWAGGWLARTRTHSITDDMHGRRAAWRCAGAAAIGVLLVVAIRFAVLGGAAGDDPHPAFNAVSAPRAILLALASLPRAVGLVLAPQLPRIDYSPTDADLAHLDPSLIVCGVALIAGAIGAFVLHIRRPGPWTFAMVFAAVTLAPVSNLVIHTGVVIAERTLYSPSIAAALAMGVATAALWQRRARVSLALAGAVAGAAILFTEISIPMWRDTPSAFAAIRARSPDSYRGYSLVASRETTAGHTAAARADYEAAIDRFSHDPVVLYQAGANALRSGDTAVAIRRLSASVAVDSTLLRARTALVMLCLRGGDTTRARALLVDGLRIAPGQRAWRATLDRLPPTGARP